jgi:hypothetical protein
MQRQLSGFPELPMPDDEHSELGVEVRAVQRDRLPDPHPGDDKQAEQGPKRRRLVRAAQRAGGFAQPQDLLVGVEVGDRTARPVGQQARRRHLDPRVDFVQVASKPADRSQPHRVPVLPAPGQCRPRERVLDGDLIGARRLEIIKELAQKPLGPGKSVAQRSTHGQVLSQRFT